MTILEKIEEKVDPHEIRLYKEGVFWVGYEHDAYRLCHIRKLRPTRRYVKAAGREVVSAGFPDSCLEDILSFFTHIARNATLVIAQCTEAVALQEYEAWKSGVGLRVVSVSSSQTAAPPGKTDSPAPDRQSYISERIRTFRLSSSTPMECMRLIEELQAVFK
jgi:hypothetical protein